MRGGFELTDRPSWADGLVEGLAEWMRSQKRKKAPKPLRRLRQAGESARRLATAGERVRPHFVVIGAQKSGTSGLYSYLVQHPQIVAPRRKELHFFDGGKPGRPDAYRLGLRWYQAQFPRCAELPASSVTGEASPSYIYMPRVAERIATHLPEARLIAVLCDPVERAISHYFHSVRMGQERLSLAEALRQEDERLRGSRRREPYQSRAFRRFSYKARGRYKEQLERFYHHLAPEQLLILDSGDLLQDPAGTYLVSLGLSPISSHPISTPAMSARSAEIGARMCRSRSTMSWRPISGRTTMHCTRI